jgi:HAD superfamily hydrolase (TIGR01509 family)
MSQFPALPVGNAVQLVILDCDGVLFDSRDANIAFYNSVLAKIGHTPLDDHGRELCHRLSGPQLWAHLFAADPVLYQRAKEAASLADYSAFYPLMRPMPALDETLARLARHCPLALATNRGRTVAGVLKYFDLKRFFSIWVGILDVPRPKPAPDLLLACLERAGVGASASVFVGDTSVDRDAAAAAAVPYIGVGPHSGAQRTIEDLRDLPDVIQLPLQSVKPPSSAP